LDSVASQTHRNIEIVLVDAAGEGIAMRFWKQTPVRVAAGEGRLLGPQAANLGLDAAQGEWLQFLDEDDEIDSDHVASLLATALVAGARVAYSQTRLAGAAGATQRVFGGGPFRRE